MSLYERKRCTSGWSDIDPSHPANSMHITHTDHYTFPLVLTRKIVIKELLRRYHSLFSPWPYCLIQHWYCKEKRVKKNRSLNDVRCKASIRNFVSSPFSIYFNLFHLWHSTFFFFLSLKYFVVFFKSEDGFPFALTRANEGLTNINSVGYTNYPKLR